MTTLMTNDVLTKMTTMINDTDEVLYIQMLIGSLSSGVLSPYV